MSQRAKNIAQNILAKADININGQQPWDLVVHDPRLFDRVLANGSLGLGESYMDGWWDVAQLDDFFYRLLKIDASKQIGITWQTIAAWAQAQLFNLQKGQRAYTIGKAHYDIGNDLYQTMLDSRMTYTCGYWQNATTLDQAQEDKLDLVCKKIGLKSGQRVLDIGCGWGSFAKFAAERYGASVVGITVSQNQIELGKKLCQGLPVELRYQDYREVNEQFDHIVSLGMFEHVGVKNYRTYMKVVERNLKPDGLFLLHTIGSNISTIGTDPWVAKYIFPNSMLPSIKQIALAIENIFVMEDWHNFSSNYDKTLMAWFANFDNGWRHLRQTYNERFYRMWKYYLLASAGGFRARKNQLWQIVLSKTGVAGGYHSIR